MSWLWIKSLAPKPLKFPKTDIGTWILLSYAHTLMHIFPKEMHTAFIYSFLCDLMIYEEVSLQLLSGQLLQNIFLNVLQLSERQLICIISLGIRAVYVFRWVSSWSPEPRAQSLPNRGLSSTMFSETWSKTPQLWITDPPQNNLCLWCTRPSPMKAQCHSSVSKMSLHFAGMNYISISKAFTPIIFRTSCRMILPPDIKSEQV